MRKFYLLTFVFFAGVANGESLRDAYLVQDKAEIEYLLRIGESLKETSSVQKECTISKDSELCFCNVQKIYNDQSKLITIAFSKYPKWEKVKWVKFIDEEGLSRSMRLDSIKKRKAPLKLCI